MDKALRTMIDNMPKKTGKSFEEWRNVLRSESFAKHSEAVNFLKNEYGVTHGFANTIVSLSKDDDTPEQDLIIEQYKGKESLIPIYELLIKTVSEFSADVNIVPKKTTVSIKTKKQFALIKPATKTRIDLGLKLPGVEPNGRLEPSGPFGTMCTHRVQLKLSDEIDEELKSWLKQAHDKSF